MESTFQFGDTEQHAFTVDFSYWTNREVYSLDGEEVRRTRHWGQSFSESFEIGGDVKHKLEVRVDRYPNWRSEVLLIEIAVLHAVPMVLRTIANHWCRPERIGGQEGRDDA